MFYAIHLDGFFIGVISLLVTCKYCSSTHNRGSICPNKPKRLKEPNLLTRFRSSYAWQKKSKEIQKRDKYLCQWCLLQSRYTFDNIEVHHIIALASDFTKRMDNNNLISLCASCHKQAEEKQIKICDLKNLVKNKE